MNNQNIFFVFCSLLCFIAPIIFCGLNSKNILNKIKLETSIIFLPVVSLIIYCCLFWTNSEFISDTYIFKFISPFLAALIFALLSLFSSKFSIRAFYVIILSNIVVFGFNYAPRIIPSYSLLINQLLLVFIWCFITLSFRLLNTLSGIVYGQLFVFCFGFYLLYIIGCAPDSLGFIVLCIGLSSLVFALKSWPPKTNLISNDQVDVLGFVIGAFMVNGSTEMLFSPLLIFILLPLCEISLALFKKITFIKEWKNLYQNTSCTKAIVSGLSPQIVANHFLRTTLLMLVIGCFQVFAPSQYSLLLISFIVCLWQIYRLSEWQNLTDGLIDSSKNIHKEVRRSLKELKNNLKKREDHK